MSKLVLELQADALDQNTGIPDLLRKAFSVSKKLDISQIERWLHLELNGYSEEENVPSYRIIHGQIKVWNPYRGWQPLYCTDHNIAEKLATRRVIQSIAELNSFKNDKKNLHMIFPERIKLQLMEGMEIPLEPILHISPSAVVGILDTVRNMVLEWSLQLEKEGILGEGMTFSSKEKQIANQISYHITNNIGHINQSQLQQVSPHAVQELSCECDIPSIIPIIHKIKETLDDIALGNEEHTEMLAEIETICLQSQSPRPKLGIINESVNSIRRILEGATGNVLAMTYLSQVIDILK
ncbi:MAG: hypothetical protein GXY07_07445 [Candidatus Hydrogenedentes bacterium]|nr:hypothetical protein [Candidatus Hydrogenedentota bacterium]